jgi:hypothetical protein
MVLAPQHMFYRPCRHRSLGVAGGVADSGVFVMANNMDAMHPQVMALPRVKFVCGRDWLRMGQWEIGFYWDANPWPRLGELIYRRRFIFRIYIDDGQI